MLEDILQTLADPKASLSDIMDSRSKLGFVLHRCCCQSAVCTITQLASLMDVLPFSTNFSIVLEASISYCLKKIPLRDRKTLCEFYSQSFRKHSISNNPDHLSNLAQFLNAGGCNLIPQPAILLQDLLDQNDEEIVSFSRKPIALLIHNDTENLSPIFWNSFSKRSEIDDKSLSFLSEITIYAPNLQLPKGDNANQLIEKIKEKCISSFSPDLQFPAIEASLLTIKWLVHCRVFIPSDVKPIYKDNALNSIAVQCWAEYSTYGDLDKIPLFEETNDPTIRKGYLQIVVGSVMNPAFEFEKVKIPHWIWHCCLREFGYNSSMGPQSLLSLSLVELDCCIDIAHILPSFIFVHAMRIRTRNSDINLRLIKLVAHTPSSVLCKQIDDFEDFVDNILQYHQLAYDLANSFRDNIVALREHMPRLINHICKGLDYFDEDNLTGRLLLLNSLFVFTSDLVPFIDIFDAIWEALSLITLSLPLCQVLFNFFGAISKFISEEKQSELAIVSIAALSAMFTSTQMPQCIVGHQIAEKVFTNASHFYSFVSSDIIVDPNYTIRDSFSLCSPALLILKNIKIPKHLIKYVLKMLTPILDVCPVEATVLCSNLIDEYIGDYKQLFQQFVTLLKKIIQYESPTAFVNVVSYFQMKASKYFPLELESFLHANILALPDDVCLTRLNLQLDPGLAPMLLTKPEQLSLLLENWAPPTSDVFLAVVAKEISEKTLTWRNEKYMRSFLRVFGYHQPPCKITTWISREFVTQNEKVECLEISINEGEEDRQTLLSEFERAYALPTITTTISSAIQQSPIPYRAQVSTFNKECLTPEEKKEIYQTNDLPLMIAAMYGKSKKCFGFLKKYLAPLASNLANNNPNAFWLLRLLGSLNIRYRFPSNVHDEYCMALGVRTKKIPAPDPSQAGDGFFAVETLSSYGSNDKEKKQKLLQRLKSTHLALKFSGTEGTASQKLLKALYNGKMSSQSRSYFIHLASFAEIRSQPTLFSKNQSNACELLKKSDLRDPVVFREIFLLIVALVTQSASSVDSSQLCDTFLTALPKNVTDVQLYEALPVLKTIVRIAGEQSRGKQQLIDSLSNRDFDNVSYNDFQSIRKSLLL